LRNQIEVPSRKVTMIKCREIKNRIAESTSINYQTKLGWLLSTTQLQLSSLSLNWPH
jgi:hypothetical protein